ncbi:MAG: HD domain-containing protein [Candidatus Xenobiia bacterium LiM19]
MTGSRVISIQMKVMKIVEEHEIPDETRDIPKSYEIHHLFSTSTIAGILARKRRAVEEEAAVTGILHDIGRILTGKQAEHACNGYEPACEILRETGLFTPPEIERIAEAVRNHSDKERTGSLLEEIIKDADILDCYLFGLPIAKESHRARLEKTLDELSLPHSMP